MPTLGIVGASLRHAGEELLVRRGGLRDYRDTGAVMGVPLVHPWANRLAREEVIVDGHRMRLPPPSVWRDEHGLPIHGLLGAHPGWSVHEADADGHARLIAGMDFAADPGLMAAFPFAHELVLEATLSVTGLGIATTVRATGSVAVPIAFGFHPIPAHPARGSRAWRVQLPARRHLVLNRPGIPAGRGTYEPPVDFGLADKGFDDGYDSIDEGAVFSVAGGGREIRVMLDAGFPAAQVFSPPAPPFMCFEPMTAVTDAVCSGAGCGASSRARRSSRRSPSP